MTDTIKYIAALVLLLFLTGPAMADSGAWHLYIHQKTTPTDEYTEIQDAIMQWTSTAKRRHKDVRLFVNRYASWLVSAARIESVSPRWLLVMGLKESELRPREGGKGETGIVQIMPSGMIEREVLSYLSKYYDRKIRRRDIKDGPMGYHAAAVALRIANRECPAWPMSWHNTGKCKLSRYGRKAQKLYRELFSDVER